MKHNFLRKSIIIVSIFVIVFLAYAGIHAYGNHKILEQYAQGYQENVFGDYCRNDSEYTFAVHKASLFSITTNLSISQNTGNTDVIIWIDLFGNIKNIGAVIVTDEETSYQVLLNRDFTAMDSSDEEIVKSVEVELLKIKDLAKSEWNI